MSAVDLGMPTPKVSYYEQGDTAQRKWSGLARAEWRAALRAGHHLRDGFEPGHPFSMANGFHCDCGGWSVTHEQVSSEACRVLSSVTKGYALWGEHVKAGA